MKIAFIGLGTMGRPMAGHLINKQHAVSLFSRSGVPQELVDLGGKAADSIAAAVTGAEVVILMLPDTPDVEKVLLGADGVASNLTLSGERRPLVIDMSSIAPGATRKFAQRVQDAGGEYLDAPVSGGEVGARAASLTIMVGGSEDAFLRARPLFEAMGKNITLVGGVGDGQITKVANQMIVAMTIEAVGEALLLASRAGADPQRVREALMGGFAASRILEVHGERMIKRTFDPGFRIELHQKDLSLAIEVARELGLFLPNTALTAQLMNASQAQGAGRQDHSALVMALEHASAHKVAGT